MIKIYPAKTNEDLKMLKILLEEYVASWSDDDGPVHVKEVEAHNQQMNNLAEYFGPPDGCLLLAKYNNESAGCVALRKLNDKTCEMKRLYVKPKLRGLKVGRDLANAVIECAKKIGYTYMRIHTITPLVQANNLYKSLGFKQIDPYEHTPRQDSVFMELKLK